MIKKTLFLLLFLLLAFLTFNFQAVLYGIQQGLGQSEVLWNSVELEEYKKRKDIPDSLLEKINLIEKIRQFAIDSIGLNDSKNYTTFYEQKGKPILWMLTASPEFEIAPYTWSFPFAGSFPYKGFFDLQKAEEEREELIEQNYDTDLGEVSAWSTLGWFRDPILSSMLERPTGSLADLIIHELSHSTIYLKDQVAFNENLANFIGKQGAIAFLKQEYGDSSQHLKDYQNFFLRKTRYRNFIKDKIPEIKQFYMLLEPALSLAEKREKKTRYLSKIKSDLMRELKPYSSEKSMNYWKEMELNNAFFSGFSTYSAKQDELLDLLLNQHQGNLKKMVLELKRKQQSD